ncbi:MAG: MMPL family transporter [Hyphomicrobiales bacterium]|nr:MMPL family transporter [Hyphomicrobiales bacterium]
MAEEQPLTSSGFTIPTAFRRVSRAGIAFGAERFAFIPFRNPAATVLVALAIAVLAVVGIQRIKTDDSLSQLFRSAEPEFKQFEQVSRDFPSSEYDVLIVASGQSLLARESVEKLRSLVADVQLIDGTRGVLSMFSMRQPAPEGGLPEPLFPDPLPEGSAYRSLLDLVKRNEIIHGKLLSDDGRLAVVILSLEPSAVDGGKLEAVMNDIRQTMTEDLQRTGLMAELTGVPVMQLEIRHALERDRILYNAVGFALGCAIAGLFFRRLSLMLVAAGPPLLAIVFALGTLGWLGFRLNMFLNVMTPLIMVISFSDSMQLTFAARDQLMAGKDKRTAFRNAILVVGPACILTHAAAGLSLLGLLASSSNLIRGFGEAGFVATAIALVTVLSLVPTFGVILIRDEARLIATLRTADPGVATLRGFCDWIARRMVSRPALFSLVGLAVVAALAAVYSGLEPSYRLADQVPDGQQALTASGRLDMEVNGSNPIQVVITFPPGLGLYTPQTLATIEDVQRVMESQRGVGNVWSLESLRRWLAEQMGLTGASALRQYVDILPHFLVRRFVAEDEKSVVVFGLVPDKNLTRLVPIVDELDARLNAVRKADTGYGIAVTGLPVIAARNSAGMINKLNRALTVEFVFIAGFIGLAFRSARIGLACLPSGIFPIVTAGSLLWVLGYGLQFSGIIALFVSFGLSLSATIHFLNRMTRERKDGEDPAPAVERATVLVGPALILTTFVLACGLAALVFSDLPPLRLFGWLGALAMLAALVADLLILRPVVTFLLRFRWQTRPKEMAQLTRPVFD